MNKYILIGALLTMLAIVTGAYNMGFDAGKNEQTVKTVIKRDKALEARYDALIKELDAIEAEKQQWADEAVRLASLGPEIRYEVIEKIIGEPGCRTRGDGYVQLWNAYADEFRESSIRPDHGTDTQN